MIITRCYDPSGKWPPMSELMGLFPHAFVIPGQDQRKGVISLELIRHEGPFFKFTVFTFLCFIWNFWPDFFTLRNIILYKTVVLCTSFFLWPCPITMSVITNKPFFIIFVIYYLIRVPYRTDDDFSLFLFNIYFFFFLKGSTKYLTPRPLTVDWIRYNRVQ